MLCISEGTIGLLRTEWLSLPHDVQVAMFVCLPLPVPYQHLLIEILLF